MVQTWLAKKFFILFIFHFNPLRFFLDKLKSIKQELKTKNEINKHIVYNLTKAYIQQKIKLRNNFCNKFYNASYYIEISYYMHPFCPLKSIEFNDYSRKIKHLLNKK